MEPEKLKALVTYICELVWIVINLVVAVLWIQCLNSQRNPDEGIPCHFNSSYVEEGFCNASYTQLACGIFDITMAVTTCLVIQKVLTGNNTVGILGAVYTAIHGAAHLAINFGIIPTDVPVNTGGYIVLAIILGIGAAGLGLLIYQKSNDMGKAVLWGVVAEFLMVFVFWKWIKDGIWVLTYVNIAINLCIFLPRIFLVPPLDPERADMYGPYFVATLLSLTIMMAVIFVEPVYCGWLVNYGGHFVFDISLFAVIVVASFDFGAKSAHPFTVYLARRSEYEPVE